MSSVAGVAAGRDIRDSQITINQNDNAEVLAAIDKLTRQIVALSPAPATGATEERVGEAIGAIARGATEGDERLQTALDLLQANNVADAVRMLQAVAEDKVARIKQDSKDAAVAYRNLGAIAGLGDPKQALEAYLKAVELDADDVESFLWVGWIELERGSLDAAEQRFKGVLALAKGEEAARYRYWAKLGLGDIRIQRGELSAARVDYLEAAAIAGRLAIADPGNAGWQRDLSVSHDKIGDVQVAQGDLAAALTSYQASLAIAGRLAIADPGNAGWQRDLSVSHNKIGDVQVAQGDLAAALTSYQASLAIADRLATADPGNAGWQRDLSVSHDKIGDVQVAQGDLAAALTSYQASLAIADRLATADPGNAGWQRDLAVSHNKIGDVQVAQGDLAAALTSYQASHDIFDRLATADPGNAGWQRDLSVSHDKIGDVQVAQGDLAAALTSYQASLAIADRLATADPGNAGWQRDLAMTNERIGDVQSTRGETIQAIAAFERALHVYRELQGRNPGDIPSRVFSVVPLWRLGRLRGREGHADLEAALAILKLLAAANRLDANRRGWIEPIQNELTALAE